MNNDSFVHATTRFLETDIGYHVLTSMVDFHYEELESSIHAKVSDSRFSWSLVASRLLVLWGIDDDTAFSVLRHSLNMEGDPELTVLAADALAHINYSPAIECLRDFKKESTLGITEIAIDRLCAIGDLQTITEMESCLADCTMRYYSAGALARVGRKEAILPLLELLRDPLTTFEKRRALLCLSFVADGSITEEIRMWMNCSDATISEAAHRSLAGIMPVGSSEQMELLVRGWRRLRDK